MRRTPPLSSTLNSHELLPPRPLHAWLWRYYCSCSLYVHNMTIYSKLGTVSVS